MALQKSDFEAYTTRPKKAVRNENGERVVIDYTDAEWDQAKKEIDVLIAGYATDRLLKIRDARQNLLNSTDWSVSNDTPLSSDDVAKMKTWRESLRDLPSSNADVDKIVFPDCPVTSLNIITPVIPVEGSA